MKFYIIHGYNVVEMITAGSVSAAMNYKNKTYGKEYVLVMEIV